MMKVRITQILGIVFLILGVLGFVNDPIFNTFEADTVHNIIHIATGLFALVMANGGYVGAITYGRIMTVIYGLVTVLGFLQPGGEGMVMGLMEINMADNWLHVFFMALFIYLGFFPTEKEVKPAARF
jgi:hypothetical protein